MITNQAAINNSDDDLTIGFQFNTPYGLFLLTLPTHSFEYSELPSTAEYIKSLSIYEATLQDIEDWLSLGIHVIPVNNAGHPGSGYIQLRFVDRRTKDVISLYIPEISIQKIPPPDRNINEKYVVHTEHLRTNIKLSSLELSDEDIQHLTVGSILLLTESFLDSWHIEISTTIALIEKVHSGILDKSLQSLSFGQEKRSTGEVIKLNQHNSVHATIDNISLPIACHLGWGEGVAECAINSQIIDSVITITLGKSPVARGNMVKISDGYGIYINSQDH
ncbi:MAG: hypothetical protein ABW101_02200 [Candidatus Thiodiazotropha sp.]